MKVFTKLLRYGVPSTSVTTDTTAPSLDHCTKSATSEPGLNAPNSQHTYMWVTTSKAEDSVCWRCWRRVYPVSLTVYRMFGQCMFGLAMLLIMTGIALCIWGYVGEPIRPFQISGPVCIGVGLLIYVVGCFMCCREVPVFEKALYERNLREKARDAVAALGNKYVAVLIQSDPELLQDFREKSTFILNENTFTEDDDVIANKYISSSDLTEDIS